jgi:hypothetical protein
MDHSWRILAPSRVSTKPGEDHFAPGGTSVPITPSGPPPMCESLPAAYGYDAAKQDCASALAADAVFAGARTLSEPPGLWDCTIGDGIATSGVLCRW